MTTETPRARFLAALAQTHVYAVTDETLDPPRMVAIVEGLLGAGIRLVQFRDKRRSDRERFETACALVRVAHAQGGLLLLNDRPDIAVAAGADGAHLGQDDLPIPLARELLGPDRVLGASASYLAEVPIAIDEGADYLGFGAVFPTATKTDAEFAGLDLFEAACKQSTIPLVGIGGIDVARAPLVMRRGAAGVAIVSALFRAPSPVDAARSLLAATAASVDAS